MAAEKNKRGNAYKALFLGGIVAICAGFFVKAHDGRPMVEIWIEKTRLAAAETFPKLREKLGFLSAEPSLDEARNQEVITSNSSSANGEDAAELVGKAKPIAPDAESADPLVIPENDTTKETTNLDTTKQIEEEFQAVLKNGAPITESKEEFSSDVEPLLLEKSTDEINIDFDILRVEKDGSTLIAGKGPADTDIEVFEGATIHAKTRTGTGGDFVALLDNPLEPGQHELLIRALPKNQDPVVSKESAFVIMPENSTENRELLAVISKPGRATEIVSLPGTAKENIEKTKQPILASEENQTKVKGQQLSLAKENIELPKAAEQTVTPSIQLGKTKAQISAIDVEPREYFIAGKGDPGRRVNVYINNEFQGWTNSSKEGAFLFSKKASIGRGRFTVRADVLDRSAKVEARVSVLLEHELEELAAELAKENVTKVESEIGSIELKTSILEESKTTSLKVIAETKVPQTSEPIQSTKKISDMKKSVIYKKVDSQEIATVNEAQKPNAMPLVPETSDVAAARPKSSKKEEKVTVAKRITNKTAKPDFQEDTVSSLVAINNANLPVLQSGKSVIIRTGDNLWKISRRMLGKGHRYTTIYSANEDQISNPHLIFPGQVFDVPGANEEAEQTDSDQG